MSNFFYITPLLLLAGCGGGVRIQEPTVEDVGGWSVGVGNVWEEEYTREDGKTERGLRATLILWDPKAESRESHSIRVYAGQVVEIGGRRWTVAEIRCPNGERGDVTLVEVK